MLKNVIYAPLEHPWFTAPVLLGIGLLVLVRCRANIGCNIEKKKKRAATLEPAQPAPVRSDSPVPQVTRNPDSGKRDTPSEEPGAVGTQHPRTRQKTTTLGRDGPKAKTKPETGPSELTSPPASDKNCKVDPPFPRPPSEHLGGVILH
uniref:Putative secreted protein n=1 Tax=Anopheles darlingi TaxID=43151 RepID=A0A2M4DIZ9_ANODA